MRYRILRGSNQIGGSITEIETDAGTRVWVDFGRDLPMEDEESTDEQMIALMQNADTRPDAVFFTHIHGDHIGLLSHIPDGVDIFIGAVGKYMMDNIEDTLLDLQGLSTEERKTLEREKALLSGKNVHFYTDRKEECYKDIRYTPLRVDHSCFDAYMLRFEADGKVYVHTGDYRSQGRLGEHLIEDIRSVLTDRPVDVLFTEGTAITRSRTKSMTEEDMEAEAERILQAHPYAFLICSSTNMESIASFYWAAVHSTKKKKALYCNSYVAKQLRLFTGAVGEAGEDWRFRFYRSYVISLDRELKRKNDPDFNMTQYQYMLNEGFIMMIGAGSYYRELMERFKDCKPKPVLIYSLWNGYLDEGKAYANPDLIATVKQAKEWGFDFVRLHTSGHATPETITEVIKTVNPREAIVPIHTENAEGFRDLDIPEEMKSKIRYSNVERR